MPARRTSVVLKLLNGSGAHDPKKLRDDTKVTPPGRLEAPPPHCKLTPPERAVFDWYLEHGVLAVVHRPTDGALLVALSRVTVQLEDVHEKNNKYGLLMRSPAGGPPRPSPYVRIERQKTEEQRVLLSELGMSPQGRLRIAPPLDGRGDDATNWDDI